MRDYSKSNNYKKAQKYTQAERLPIGGYVCKILEAKEETNDWGDKLIISFDIAEGDYKDFFAKQYRANTSEDKKWKGVFRGLHLPAEEDEEWKFRRLKTFAEDFIESNNGYMFDWNNPATLKGKLIGVVFNDKEYEINGRTGFYTNAKLLTNVDAIREGTFKQPSPDLLDNSTGYSSPAPTSADGFMQIPDGAEEELPF